MSETGVQGGLRDVRGEGLKPVEPSVRRLTPPQLTLCFSLAAFTQGAVVGGGGGPRQNNVSFHLSLHSAPSTSHSFAYKVRSACRTVSYPDALAHAVRHFDCGGTESRRNNKILMSRGRESRPLVCTKGSTKPQKWNECAINVHLSCASRGSR